MSNERFINIARHMMGLIFAIFTKEECKLFAETLRKKANEK